MKKRIPYLISAAVLLAAELLIGAFAHDAFVRPYLGDVLVTALLCALARTALPEKPRLLPLWVFVFAAAVEAAQYFDIASVLAPGSELARIALGATFDPADTVCYFVGCLLFASAEFIIRRKRV